MAVMVIVIVTLLIRIEVFIFTVASNLLTCINVIFMVY